MADIGKMIGERIRALRVERNLSQEALALKAEVNKSFMGEVERGESSPTIKTLEKVVNALDIGFEELFSSKSDNSNPRKFETIEMINYDLQTRSKKQQEAAYKLLKTFFSLVDKNEE